MVRDPVAVVETVFGGGGEGKGGFRGESEKEMWRVAPPGIRLTNPVVVAGVEVAPLGSARTVCQVTLQTLHRDPAQGSFLTHH